MAKETESTPSARYDGLADWYDHHLTPFTESVTPLIERELGRGQGRCLDLGCGVGTHVPALAGLGWSVVGVDVSGDQLRLAESRVGNLAEAFVQSDAGSLPFPSASFDAVLAAFIHTDVDDFAAVAQEAARVLRSNGSLLVIATHPCFIGHFAERTQDGKVIVHPGYQESGWYTTGPGISSVGLRSRVGARHVRLAEFLNAVLDAGLQITHVAEQNGPQLPDWLALSARKPGASANSDHYRGDRSL